MTDHDHDLSEPHCPDCHGGTDDPCVTYWRAKTASMRRENARLREGLRLAVDLVRRYWSEFGVRFMTEDECDGLEALLGGGGE